MTQQEEGRYPLAEKQKAHKFQTQNSPMAWIPYYGYGSGIVRLSLGDNTELGGAVGGGYVRWNFFPDASVFVGDVQWVKDGEMVNQF